MSLPKLTRELSNQVRMTLMLKNVHLATWRNRRESYWSWRLLLEVGELVLALCHMHRHDPYHELRQIAAICLNWQEMCAERERPR